MKLIPHHLDDNEHGQREYRSPDGAWRVVRPRRRRNERSRWEVHERHEVRADWRRHAAFERRRDALVFLDTSAVTPGENLVAAAAAPKERETSERSAEPDPSAPRRPKGPITHDIDETRSEGNIRWSLCGVLIYDEKQLPRGGEPASCRKCQRFTTAASYRKRQKAKKAVKKEA